MIHQTERIHWARLGVIIGSIATLLVLTVWVYLPSLHYPFEFDDLSNIVKLFQLRFATFRSLFFANSRWLSYWLNASYYSVLPEGHKFDPYLYRLGNLIIHLVAGSMVYLVTLLLQRSSCAPSIMQRAGLLLPFLTAGLFLLHPVQTQTVSYVIQGQLEGGAGVFILSMLVAFLVTATASYWLIRWIAFAVLCILAVFACGSKEIIIITPVLLLLVDWFFVSCGSWSELKRHWWMHAVITLIIVGLYLYLLKPQYFLTILGCSMELQSNVGNMLTESRLEKITAGSFFISQFKVIVHYIGIFFWPFMMSVDYDWKLTKHFLAPEALFPFLLLSGLAVYICMRLRRNQLDLVAFCVLWFFIGILPRSSIIPSTELLADYKTYAASFGIYLLQACALSWLLLWLYERPWWRGGRVLMAALGVVVLACVAYGAQWRNRVWRSPAAFWSDVIAHAPNRARAHNNYGVALCELGRHQEAVTYFKRAVALDGHYADPYTNLSVAYSSLQRFDEAIDAMRKGIRIMPYQPEGYNNLASVLMNRGGDDHEAEGLLRRAVQLRPHYGKAYFNLGKFYLKHQRNEEAWEAYKMACTKADFDTELGFTVFGNVSCTLGKYADAVYAYTKALVINPHSLELAVRRVYALEQAGEREQAHRELDTLLHAYPAAQATLLAHLADLWFDQKVYHKALRLYEQAVAQKPTIGIWYKIAQAAERAGQPHLARQAKERLLATRIPAAMREELERIQ